MVYQVGRPAMFEGNMFLPDTGTPIWKIERSKTRFAVWLPDPLTVATWMLKSLTIRRGAVGPFVPRTATSLGDMGCPSATGALGIVDLRGIIASDPRPSRRRGGPLCPQGRLHCGSDIRRTLDHVDSGS